MKLPHRRQFLHVAVGAAALPEMPRIASAQAYPSRPVRMIVGFPAGNASDIIARVVAQAPSDRLGQQFVVENRPGATGMLATGVIVKAAPDGYTLLMEVLTGIVLSSALYSNLNYEFMRDITPIARLGEGAYVMVVNSSVPADSLPQFIALCQSEPREGQYGVGRQRRPDPRLWRTVQDDGRDRDMHVPYRGRLAGHAGPCAPGGNEVFSGPLAIRHPSKAAQFVPNLTYS